MDTLDFEKASLLTPESSEQEDQSPKNQVPNNGHPKRRAHCILYLLLVLILLTLLLSALVNVATWRLRSHLVPVCIFDTDLPDSRHAIQYEQRVFTGALVYDSESRRVVRKLDAEQEYFGPPSREIEQAWRGLLDAEFPVMTAEEAALFEPALKVIPSTQRFHFEPDVFHNLHCVSAIRIAMSQSLYNVSVEHHHQSKAESLPEGWEQAHMEHCLDRLRQAIMCAGDLTPSPMYTWLGFHHALGRTNEHTCRKWQPIRDWMDERGRKGPVLN